MTSWTAAQQASLSFTISLSLLKFMSTELVMTSNHLVLCQPFSSCLNLSPKPQLREMVWGGRWEGVQNWEHVYTHGGFMLMYGRSRAAAKSARCATTKEQPKGSTPRLRPGAVAGRSYPSSEARGGLEESPCPQGQGRWLGETPCPRSRGCVGTGGPRGAIPC